MLILDHLRSTRDIQTFSTNSDQDTRQENQKINRYEAVYRLLTESRNATVDATEMTYIAFAVDQITRETIPRGSKSTTKSS